MKTNFWRSLSPRRRKLISWVLGLLLFYAITGFFILPPIIRIEAVKILSAQLDRKVSIQKVKVNPFAPSIDIKGFLILDKDSQPFVSWDEVYVNFQVTSVFLKDWTFKEIRVVHPYARAEVYKDFTFNFSDLITKFSTNAPAAAPQKPSKLPLVRVKYLNIAGARLSVADFMGRTPFKRIIGPLDFTLDDFRTEPEKNSLYWFAGATDTGENFYWRGRICLDPLSSYGELSVGGVVLTNFTPLYQDLMPFEIHGGQIGVRANYRCELIPSNQVAVVTNAAFALWDFQLAQPGATNDLLQLQHLGVTGVNADAIARQAEIGHIMVSGGKIFFQRPKEQSVSVAQASPANEGPPDLSAIILPLQQMVTNYVALLLKTTNLCAATLDDMGVTNCSAHLEDDANLRPATLDLDNITVEAKNISNVPKTNLTASVSMNWNKTGTINVEATALISPLTADVHLDLDGLTFNTLDPYLESQLNLLVPDGKFSMNSDVHVSTLPDGLPNVEFKGDTSLNDFRSVDGVMGEDLLKWGTINVSGIDVSLDPLNVSINKIFLDGVSPQVVIETNGTINLLEALNPAETNGIVRTNAVVIAKTSTATSTNASLLQGLPPISISSIVITNTGLNYTDRSLTPNVHLPIQNVDGTITGLSSQELQHGDVDLHVLVGDVGLLHVTGHINPFSGTQTNEVTIFMTNMDLLPTSPYSGKFAGYRIAEGNLNLDQHFELVGRKLKSQNVITINRFMFGEKVNSPDATKLPVRLGVALLKDRDGNIVLDVPIEGSLDDPKFRIGKVVVRVIVNILTKAATSPFSLLGAAFGGGGEELSYDDFTPGSAELTDASKKKLDVLVKALFNRPALQLEISGSIDPVNDRDGLQRLAFEKQLRTRQWKSLGKSEQETITPDQVVLTPDDRAHWVKKMYDEALNNGQITPAILAANTNLAAIAKRIKSPAGKQHKLAFFLEHPQPAPQSQAATTSASSGLPPIADPKEALLVALIPISDSDFETLAINRAKAVRAYILSNGQVEASRLFLTQSQSGGLRQDGNRVYLELN